MKLFTNNDVNFLGKRSRMNLNEVKNLMTAIDDAATKAGKRPAAQMSPNQASECFNAGLPGLNFASTTPTGKQRNIMRLKWSTLTKYTGNQAGATPTKEEKVEAARLAVETAKQELIEPTEENADQWWYEHEDGAKRRVPSTYKFPMLGLEEMYVLWHVGDPANKISPMKLFQATDVSFIKRSKTNLSEVRAVMTIIDLEAAKRGTPIKSNMTVAEARECCRSGYLGLNIPTHTPDGRARDILRIKWSSAVRLKNKKPDEDDELEELGEAELDV